SLSFFSDTQLLEPGISIFSAALGFRQNRTGDFRDPGYEESPVFSGFYQRGVNDWLTLGGTAQVDKDHALVSGQAVVATALGIFGAEGAADLNERDETQFAALVSYRLRSTSESGRVSSFDVDVQYRSRDFSPMAEARAEPNRYRYDIAARYQTELLED